MGNPEAFAEAAAQIIPVLVLALLADPVNRGAHIGQSGLILVALFAGVTGEVVALTGVVSGTDRDANALISVSMWVLAVAILAPHVSLHFRNAVSRVPVKIRILGRAVYAPLFGAIYLVAGWSVLPRPLALFLGLGVAGWGVDNYFRGKERWQAIKEQVADDATINVAPDNQQSMDNHRLEPHVPKPEASPESHESTVVGASEAGRPNGQAV
ncbi:hypothetical protein [Terrabacter sp. MAHUQ-38]|uniref:hypothetical protein n=1 Tax=unclassified Terrabacter TaxID=2630222 RepID=UPI00165E20FB|nr:hypothetical protein [Terrabacter sp. MAHUQ-38]MBC9822844.1 hypothetical protein [Terrabacter sp. MAHUQ-38]